MAVIVTSVGNEKADPETGLGGEEHAYGSFKDYQASAFDELSSNGIELFENESSTSKVSYCSCQEAL